MTKESKEIEEILLTNYKNKLSGLVLSNMGLDKIPNIELVSDFIRILHIDNNRLKNLDGIEPLTKLELLIIDNNYISSLAPLFKLKNSQIIRLNNNPLSFDEVNKLFTINPKLELYSNIKCYKVK